MPPPSSRLAFLSQDPPPNYIAGIGRGATGFTTRADLGGTVGIGAEDLASALKAKAEGGDADDDDGNGVDGGDAERFADAPGDGDRDPDNEVALFAGLPYDREDADADRTYDLIELRRRRRRKTQDAQRELEEREATTQRDSQGKVVPSIAEQFKDVRSSLSTVTEDEWANLPEVGDLTRKNKRARLAARSERFYAVPDSLLASGLASTQFEKTVTEEDDTEDSLVKTSLERDKVLGLQIDQASSGTATAIDAQRYLTTMASQTVGDAGQISDVKKARLLLSSVTQTNPSHAPGWIAAARLEEVAGKIVAARDIMQRACEACPRSTDIWLERARLNTPPNAKRILAQAASLNPRAVEIWMAAIRLEETVVGKRRVVRRGLEFVPESVELWKEAVNLENDRADARLLLARAVEVVPGSTALWLALARLETVANARKVLNRARIACPDDLDVWLEAAKLEERSGGDKTRINGIVARAIALPTLQARPNSDWLEDARKCERDGDAPKTAAAIVTALFQNPGTPPPDLSLADTADSDGCPAVAAAVYEAVLARGNTTAGEIDTASVWERYAEFALSHKTSSAAVDAREILDRACTACPRASSLWLSLSQLCASLGDVAGASRVLEDGLSAVRSGAGTLWVALSELSLGAADQDRATDILARAITDPRHQPPDQQLYLRIITFLRRAKQTSKALTYANDALTHHPHASRLITAKAAIQCDLADIGGARATYASGVRVCGDAGVWVSWCRFEESVGSVSRARVVCERGRTAVGGTPGFAAVALEGVLLEARAGEHKQASLLLAAALKALPLSQELWALAIDLAPKPSNRLPTATQALKATANTPASSHTLLATVARVFAADIDRSPTKIAKARAWFARAIDAAPADGDIRGYLYVWVKGLPEGDTEGADVVRGWLDGLRGGGWEGVLWSAWVEADVDREAALEEVVRGGVDRETRFMAIIEEFVKVLPPLGQPPPVIHPAAKLLPS
ncbi:U4/U6 x U5 tri-snRNP complex subunit Prp1 [Savitreella phatthalungensis]